ncbi:MAG: lipoate--protein ligase family protein [Candidatus Brocadiae bacterium]|nr:lipoate--protein ligase family protein [Candidatus Brocadiia bacterium]
MLLVQFKSQSPAEHLACDEVLLRKAQSGELDAALRLYEIERPTVVIGVGGRHREEVDFDACVAQAVAVLRRHTGGGAVVLAAGCLVYSLVLSTRTRPPLRSVLGSYRWILSRLAASFAQAGLRVERAGVSDLAWRGRKVGGSAQRRLRHALLHHGTLLYGADLSLLDPLLGRAVSPPGYRAGRRHREFVANLPLARQDLGDVLAAAFQVENAGSPLDVTDGLMPRVRELATAKYASDGWNLRL